MNITTSLINSQTPHFTDTIPRITPRTGMMSVSTWKTEKNIKKCAHNFHKTNGVGENFSLFQGVTLEMHVVTLDFHPATRWYNFKTLPKSDDFRRTAVESVSNQFTQ